MITVTDGKVLKITAEVECGACGKVIKVRDVDPNEGPTAWDAVIAKVWAGLLHSSVQDGYFLCRRCTRKVDDHPSVPEDRNATRDEVRAILGID